MVSKTEDNSWLWLDSFWLLICTLAAWVTLVCKYIYIHFLLRFVCDGFWLILLHQDFYKYQKQQTQQRNYSKIEVCREQGWSPKWWCWIKPAPQLQVVLRTWPPWCSLFPQSVSCLCRSVRWTDSSQPAATLLRRPTNVFQSSTATMTMACSRIFLLCTRPQSPFNAR